MVNAPAAGASEQRSGWRKGCGTLIVILGFTAVAVIALLLGGYTVASLSSSPPERGEIIKQMEELVDVVDDFFGGDDEANTSGSEPAPKPTATFTPTPVPPPPTPTKTPTPTPSMGPPGGQSNDSPADAAADVVAVDEPEPIPDPEPSEGLLSIEMTLLGLVFKSREYYSTGTVAAGLNRDNDPHAFVKSGMPSMDIRLRTMPTDRFPGATPAGALPVLFQERVADPVTSSGVWTVVTDPFDLDVNGLPAARMAADFRRSDDKTFCYHMTAIRGDTRSSFVYGSYGGPCANKPNFADEINVIADSVQLSEPAPVCSVGLKPDSDPADYGVGCDYLPLKWIGVDALVDAGYTDIVLGFVTWDECAAFMRDHDQPRW